MSDNRPIVYLDERIGKWVYRASSVGRPLRCLISAKQGYQAMDPPKYLTQAAEAGVRSEVIVKAMLRNQGYRISGEQGEVELPVGDTAIIRGHMDAEHCVDPEGVDRPLEVKSMGQRVWEDWWKDGFAGFPEYAAQLSVYMGAISKRRGREVEAVYALYNRGNPGQMETIVVRTPPADLEAIKAKVLEAEAWGDKDLPQCTGAKYFCGYEYICDRNEIQFTELESGTKETFVRLGEEYGDIEDALKELEVRKELLREELKTAMGAREKVDIPGWGFTYKSPTPRKSLSVERLRQKMGDELDGYFDSKEVAKTLMVRRKST